MAPEAMTMSSDRIPSLEVLGDRMEQAATRAMAPARSGRQRFRQVAGPGRRGPSAVWLLTPALTAVVVVVTLAAIVGGPTTPPAHASVLAAASKTVDASTGRFIFQVALGTQQSGDDMAVVTLAGVYDVASGRVAADVDLRSLLDGSTTEGEMFEVVLAGGDRAAIVVDGPVAYVWSPLFATALGSEWARLDLERLLGTSPASGTWALAPTDPAAFLQLLTGLDGPVTEEGTEEIDGQVTTRYRGEVRISKALEQLDPDERADVEGELARLGVDPSSLETLDPVPFVVWIDRDGLIRRIESRFTVPGVAGSPSAGAGSPEQGQLARFTVDYRDIGAPVEIPQLPAEALDATGLVERLVPRFDPGS